MLSRTATHPRGAGGNESSHNAALSYSRKTPESAPGYVASDAAVSAEAAAMGTPLLHLLVVEGEPSANEACCSAARELGYFAAGVATPEAALEALAHGAWDLVLLDISRSVGGIGLLEEIRRLYPRTDVVTMTSAATVENAVEAMRNGAVDYLTKPFVLDELLRVLEEAQRRQSFQSESRKLRERMRTQAGMGDLIGRSPEMQKLYRIVSKVAFSTHPVLILGESGTGKERVAHAIHRFGPLGRQPFVAVDCGALSPTLIESELFGHVKGAFTGAHQARVGLLAAAEGGTVFLDEIGELPLELQAKLLRALQEREVRPIGSSQTVPIAARILAATNRELPAMVESGNFRKDLYYRLNVVNLRIPPLRLRREDIPLLAAHFLEKAREQSDVEYVFSDEMLQVMQEYEWPGNVRELENLVQRMCAMSSGPVLNLADMTTQLQNFHAGRRRDAVQVIDARLPEVEASAKAERSEAQRIVSLAEQEKEAIVKAIQQLNGDKLLAARLLGIGKTTLYRKLKEYGIQDL